MRVGGLRREHVEAFIADLLARKAPATAHDRYHGCQAFFAWCMEEGEIRESPMVRMRPPRLQTFWGGAVEWTGGRVHPNAARASGPS